ncbi:MAG: 16S rRNA (cytidine(1402)-2'-O)-methyltransferase [Candidatus Daviesbacteria bacterium]|nr:16S rRNA (cytidine(1402)-2'-O)-methyltransferase [Candidatus Daviesbacteria bacterium]
MGKLSIIATPIGNLKDITLRAIEALQNSDAIICEDSRRTSILLNTYEIKHPFIILNNFNENRVYPQIIQRLINGENLCLVSDGGTPLISDPGYKLIRSCLEQGLEVDSLPGPSSVITALTLSGLPPDKFLFLGYLPEKPGKRIKQLQELYAIRLTLSTTYIIFVAPHKLIRTLENMLEVFGDIKVCLARELTKIHQSVMKQKINVWLEDFEKVSAKGEIILLFNLN